MAGTQNQTPAEILLGILDWKSGTPTPSDAVTDQAVGDFICELTKLDSKHNARPINPKYLAEQVFGRSRELVRERDLIPFCRCHLRVALCQLSNLIAELRAQNAGAIAFSELSKWQHTIRDYVFDLRSIVLFLERKNSGYRYFDGGKNSGVHSWEVFLLARGLAYQSSHWAQGPFNHKAAQIASIAVLRQAMELRFERIISVYPTDVKGKPPKLKHGFHQDFIAKHQEFFDTNGLDLTTLRHVYDWCSEIVHQAYQPYAWQLAWGLQLAGGLLNSHSVPPTQAWSIANAIEILDVEKMQAKFEQHFLDTYGHGRWKMTRHRPEALVKNWTPEMQFTSPDFHSVRARKSVFASIKARLVRWLR